MRLAEAYRSLARPSSALEPSHPLAGISSLCPTKLSERLVAKPVHGFLGLHPRLGQTSTLPHRVSLDVCIWTCWDSDPGPPPCKGGALPAELQALLSAPSLIIFKAGWTDMLTDQSMSSALVDIFSFRLAGR